MSVAEVQTAAEDEESWSLPGLELQHDMHLTLQLWDAWDEIAWRLKRSGAEFASLNIAKQGNKIAVRCRVKRLSPKQARTFIAAVLAEGHALAGGVEHLMLAEKSEH